MLRSNRHDTQSRGDSKNVFVLFSNNNKEYVAAAVSAPLSIKSLSEKANRDRSKAA